MIERLLLAIVVLSGCGESQGATPELAGGTPAAGVLGLADVVSGLSNPVYLTAPTGDARLFVVEQPGRIRVVKNGTVLSTPFLDITSKVKSGGEQGLLSVAFHPSYSANGFFYVNYTNIEGDTRIERYTVSSNPDKANPASAKTILAIAQPFANHNGGLNLFGPDGMLYVGMGDGGNQGDPSGNGQNTNSLLAKLLRIDVDHGDPYSIPDSNPFAKGGGRPEIWAYGLRNPWRFTFDTPANLLYIADVGQNKYEEVDAVRSDRRGLNFGWNIMEGASCYTSLTCTKAGLTLPVLTYGRDGGACSIIGGMVYRGSAVPKLAGHFVYADYCAGWIRSFKLANNSVTASTQWQTPSHGTIVSFGKDAAGELYVLSTNGHVYRIIDAHE